VRRLELLAPLRVSILSDRRRNPPFGLAGGGPGAPGRNAIQGHEHGPAGPVEPLELAGRATVDAATGAVMSIETPGGGGYGPADLEPHEPSRGG
jgi:5-oxoprolinase (ATP-hydrolysing)